MQGDILLVWKRVAKWFLTYFFYVFWAFILVPTRFETAIGNVGCNHLYKLFGVLVNWNQKGKNWSGKNTSIPYLAQITIPWLWNPSLPVPKWSHFPSNLHNFKGQISIVFCLRQMGFFWIEPVPFFSSTSWESRTPRSTAACVVKRSFLVLHERAVYFWLQLNTLSILVPTWEIPDFLSFRWGKTHE